MRYRKNQGVGLFDKEDTLQELLKVGSINSVYMSRPLRDALLQLQIVTALRLTACTVS